VRRLPIRLRLTLAFATAMAVVLAATGGFVYFRLSSSLDNGVSENLDARLIDVSALARRGETGRTTYDEGFTDISQGPARLGVYELEQVPGVEGRVRALAASIETPDGRRTVVVGSSLADRDEALRELLAQLLIVAPVALLLSSLLGYWLARSALHPVEAIRAEAAAISGSEPGRRLPSGDSRDEIARLAGTLNEMLARLERAIERERSFVADASHELRTPLALLKAELDLALRKPRTAAELELSLSSAAGETDRLVRLAEDLLVLAQSDDGRLPLRQDTIGADDLIGSVQEAFRRRADSEGRTIEGESADSFMFTADRVRLEQALGNLVDNALRHGAGPVRLSAFERYGRVELHVLDEGDGFPPDFLPHAFERFGRADQARTSSGAGLGLALASAVAEAHGGTAHAVNREEGGADVWLSIPRG
jgi:two-component system OmpR family sensor kinase